MPRVDKPFLILLLILLFAGFFIFLSASLGKLAAEEVNFGFLVFKQLSFGIIFGLILLYATSKIDYKFWNKYSIHIFIFAILITLAVFLPKLGFTHGGARRWISIGNFTFQPAEILKIGFVIYMASWFAGVKNKIKTFKYGFLPLLITLVITGAILLRQPDTGTFLVLLSAGLAMFISAGGRWRDLFIIFMIGIIGFAFLVSSRPYLKDRITTFLDPSIDPRGSSYQIQQSLIAIGSGQIFGRGFGQSLQKFNHLPEATSDSIFAVFAEEWGIVGALLLITLFVLFTLRGLKIASHSPSMFSGLLVVGIITLIISQSFINMASMLGIVPLTGIPLIFVSHGGTAMLFALAEVGIVLNISRSQRE